MLIKNLSDDNIILSFPIQNLEMQIPSGTATEPKFSFSEESIEIVIKEKDEKSGILGYILAFLISIPLCLINCFNFEQIDKAIKLPVKIRLNKNQLNSTLEIKDSKEKLKNYELLCDNKKLDSDLFFTLEDLQKEIRNYNISNVIMFLFPFICLIVLSVMFFISGNITGAVILSAALLLLLLNFYIKHSKNIKILKNIKSTICEK